MIVPSPVASVKGMFRDIEVTKDYVGKGEGRGRVTPHFLEGLPELLAFLHICGGVDV